MPSQPIMIMAELISSTKRVGVTMSLGKSISGNIGTFKGRANSAFSRASQGRQEPCPGIDGLRLVLDEEAKETFALLMLRADPALV